MSRRDTIIISVLVNAALIAVLFISAVTTKSSVEDQQMATSTILEKTAIEAKEMFAAKTNQIEEKPAIEDTEKDIQNQFVSLMEEKNLIDAKPIQKEEEKIVYKLPEVVRNVEKIPTYKEDVFEIIIKSGDTLERIARANQVKIAQITKLNGLENSFLKIGQKLLIPKVTNTIQKIDSLREIRPIQKTQSEFYVVKVGDNPYTIAIKHSIKPNELLKLNNLDEKKARRLKPGDKLRIR
ncbi:MAG: Muramidase-2 [Candidatus Anoxychlamydiales bacterium]|nr:Muramidase-2 [Candidatus Anoxychlamydiales bacterium]